MLCNGYRSVKSYSISTMIFPYLFYPYHVDTFYTGLSLDFWVNGSWQMEWLDGVPRTYVEVLFRDYPIT